MASKNNSFYLNLIIVIKFKHKGVNVNKLVVYTFINGFKKDIFTSIGNQGRAWRIARIDLNISDRFQIQFEAFRGDGIRGFLFFIYLDKEIDIVISNNF